MELSARSYLTTGIAALGVSAVALSPVQPVAGHRALASEHAVVSAMAVNLAAAIDPITPWVDTIKSTWDNVTGLAALYLQQPLPILTTIARNQLTYLQELPDIALIASQVWGNAKTFFTAPYDPTPINISDALVTDIAGLPISQLTVYALLQTMIQGSGDLEPLTRFAGTRISPDLQPLLEFTATPVSGELIGLLGPAISPLISLTRSFTAIGEYFQQGDVAAALNELINIPANTTNAALNGGGFLDLTGVVKSAGYTLPPEVKRVGFNMGGLLNVVPIAYEPPTVPNSDLNPFSGGLAFDALATDVESTFITFNDPGWPVGAIGSVIGLGQALGDAMLVTPPAPAVASAAPAAATAGPVDAVPVGAADPVAAPADVAPETPEPKRSRAAAGSADSGNDKATRAAARGGARSAGARHAG